MSFTSICLSGLLLICFGIVCVIFSQLCFMFSVFFCFCFAWFKWCLFGSDSCSISSASCFRLPSMCSVHIRIYYKYPVEAKKRENLPFFFLVCRFWANHLELCEFYFPPFLYRHLLGDYLFLIIIHLFYSVKIRKQDGFVSVWFRYFVVVICVMYQKGLWNAK